MLSWTSFCFKVTECVISSHALRLWCGKHNTDVTAPNRVREICRMPRKAITTSLKMITKHKLHRKLPNHRCFRKGALISLLCHKKIGHIIC